MIEKFQEMKICLEVVKIALSIIGFVIVYWQLRLRKREYKRVQSLECKDYAEKTISLLSKEIDNHTNYLARNGLCVLYFEESNFPSATYSQVQVMTGALLRKNFKDSMERLILVLENSTSSHRPKADILCLSNPYITDFETEKKVTSADSIAMKMILENLLEALNLLVCNKYFLKMLTYRQELLKSGDLISIHKEGLLIDLDYCFLDPIARIVKILRDEGLADILPSDIGHKEEYSHISKFDFHKQLESAGFAF